jgi:hypothetical protein
MIKFTVTSRIIFVALTLWLVFTLVILSGCKDKDQSEDTPDSYLSTLLEGKTLGKKMKVWYVQKAKTRIKGVVCRVRNPEDTPDLETVMLGFAPGKPYEAAAISRHGNFLQWGYSASPSEMTPAGGNLFVNCIHYIHAFDGKRPTAGFPR